MCSPSLAWTADGAINVEPRSSAASAAASLVPSNGPLLDDSLHLEASTNGGRSEWDFHSVDMRDIRTRDTIASSAHQMAINRHLGRRTVAVLTILIGLLTGFLWTISISWVVLTAAGVLAMAECYLKPHTDHTASILGQIDGGLLMMVGGFFIVVTGARATGFPDALYGWYGSLCGNVDVDGLDFDNPADVALYAVLVLCLSQLGSNVPTVMFLSAKLSASQLSPHVHETAWTVLAFSSTVAGNLTLTGSVANLITAEKANLSGLELSFGRHLRFALPTTVVIAVGGSLLVFVSASRWV